MAVHEMNDHVRVRPQTAILLVCSMHMNMAVRGELQQQRMRLLLVIWIASSMLMNSGASGTQAPVLVQPLVETCCVYYMRTKTVVRGTLKRVWCTHMSMAVHGINLCAKRQCALFAVCA